MILATHALSLDYGSRRVVDTLSMSIEQGRITALVGANGCGKSTLLRALAGLHTPQSGDVLLNNRALKHWPRKHLARHIAFLKQTQAIPEGLSVIELVRHGRFAHQTMWRGATHEDRAAVQWALDVTGLLTLQHRPLMALSGGERQRVWIAMALAQQAAILLLDEPTTYLDLGHQLEVLQLLQQLNQELGLTLVMALHDLNQAMRYADHIWVMRHGRIMSSGAPREVLTPALIQKVFHVHNERLYSHKDNLPVCHPYNYVKSDALDNECIEELIRNANNVYPLKQRASNDRS